MPVFSVPSERNLNTVHPALQRVIRAAIKRMDFAVEYGHRSRALQFELFQKGRVLDPKTGKWRVIDPKLVVTNCDGYTIPSTHNRMPSDSADLVPCGSNGKKVWGDRAAFHRLKDIMFEESSALGIMIRWGGDWDRDGKEEEPGEYDLPHFERVIATPGVLDVVSVCVDLNDRLMMEQADAALEVMARIIKERSMALGISAIQAGVPMRVMILALPRLCLAEFDEAVAMYNPMIIEKTGKNPKIAEGCLSVPGVKAIVERRMGMVRYGWQDRAGALHERTVEGWEAVLVQHELDHMAGKLFIDGMSRQVRREAMRAAEKQRSMGGRS